MADTDLIPAAAPPADPGAPPAVREAAALVAVELDRIQQAARNTDRIASDPEMIAVWLRNQVSDHTRASYEHAWNAWQAHSGAGRWLRPPWPTCRTSRRPWRGTAVRAASTPC
ncbi:MAG: hypothetical protein OXC13_15150 [Caldilineaceae bacterium]|nr:hypothetical protein [Caldilineaceae bacterium]